MKTSKKSLRISFIVFLILFLQSGIVSAFEITIDVAPNVLNLNSQGTVVTVHTDIAYSSVLGSSVCLNNVPIDYWKSDDRGNFVAKFKMSDIEALPFDLGKMNTFILTGQTKDGESFQGSQDIKVIKAGKLKLFLNLKGKCYSFPFFS